MQPNWIIPGTTLTIKRSDACRAEGLFQSMFLTGGLSLSQVANISGLEPYAIQNWVKRGFLSSPKQKHYDMDQVCRILTINTLRDVLTLEEICKLLASVNGQLDSEADDIIGDAQLYFLFVDLAGRARDFADTEEALRVIWEGLAEYKEPFPGAKERIAQALRVMLIGWLAARMVQNARRLLNEKK